ncbi:MAG: redoxin family protein [Clostridia bacterium]|nr:redoxin family protein [Clostridia bacterium]
MADLKARLTRFLPTRRRLIQLYAALLYNAHARGFITGQIYTGPVKNLCVPGLNCYSCPGAVGACPLGALQNALSASGVRAPWYVLGILMLTGLTLGRIVCGWLCPVGMVQELVHKLPTPKVRKNRVTRVLSYLKYVILAVLVIAVPLIAGLNGMPLPAFCKYICPAGTLEGGVGLLAHPDNAEHFSMLGWLFTHKFVLAVVIAAACVFVYRAFCRFLCPLGAIYGLFAKVSLLGVKVEANRCTDCGACLKRCPMDIRCVGDRECIQCGACASVCAENAIVWKCAAKNEKARKCRRIAGWTAAVLLLAGVLVAVNLPSAPVETTVPPAVDVPVGAEPGMLAADFTVPLYGGGTFTLSEHRGRVVVLNFWATWCGPCVKELPHFQQLADTYPEDVTVIAIHGNLVTEDVPAYLARQSYTMPFALDETGGVLAGLGGSMMLPQTVIIDRSGVITYNRVGSMDWAALEAQIVPLL